MILRQNSASHNICMQFCSALFCCGYSIRTCVYYCDGFTYIFRVTSLALGQSYDCPSASEVTLKDMGKSGPTEPQQNTAEHKPYSYFMGYTLQPAVWYYVITLELTESKALCKIHKSSPVFYRKYAVIIILRIKYIQPAVWYYVITLELTESKALCKYTSQVQYSTGNLQWLLF